MIATCVEQTTRQILDYFESLARMGREMNSSVQITQALNSTVSAMVEAFDIDRAVLLAAHDSQGHLLPVVEHNVPAEALRPVRVPRSIQETLVKHPEIRSLESFSNGFRTLLALPKDNGHGQGDSAVVPLVSGRELVGLFLMTRIRILPPLVEHDRDLLCGMCQNIAVYLHNQVVLARLTRKQHELKDLFGRVKDIYREAVMAFLTAIDIKDGYTKDHSLRVARLASILAQELGFSEEEAEGVYFAGLLHDIGKILVDKEILTKRGGLDLTEYAEMSQHSHFGAEILSNIQFPWENVIYAIRHHHDPPGYDEFSPRHQRNFDTGIKIIGLIDAFDAMTSNRPYRRALCLSECFAELTNGLSMQFDPEVTRVFLKMLERDLDCPPRHRKILADQTLDADLARIRKDLAAALDEVERIMGIVTTY